MWIQRDELRGWFRGPVKENGICAGIRHEVSVPVFFCISVYGLNVFLIKLAF